MAVPYLKIVFAISNKLGDERFVVIGAVTLAICLVVAVTLRLLCAFVCSVGCLVLLRNRYVA
jgi:hypothetical protein